MKVMVMATGIRSDEIYMVRGMTMNAQGEVDKISVKGSGARSTWQPVQEFNLVPITIETDGGRKL